MEDTSYCKKCKKPIPDDAAYCPWCGMRQERPPARLKTRANGTGTAYRRGKTWTAEITLGYSAGKNGKAVAKRRTKGGFSSKTAALEYCAALKGVRKKESGITVLGLFDDWMPTYQERVAAKTAASYRSAFKHFKTIYYLRFQDVKADDWQRCIDACPRGKRVKEDMRTVAGMLCKHAYNIDLIDKNYAAHLYTGKDKKGTRPPFSSEEVEKIRKAVGAYPYADYVYFLIYTGFRPSELFALRVGAYDQESGYLVGGGKTKAGTDRIVTISPKIRGIAERQASGASDYLFPRPDGSKMTEDYFRKFCFCPLMDILGISGRFPYSCRHTFANLLKAATGSDTDKAELMGHADASMTKYYQSADINSLRAITDVI